MKKTLISILFVVLFCNKIGSEKEKSRYGHQKNISKMNYIISKSGYSLQMLEQALIYMGSMGK